MMCKESNNEYCRSKSKRVLEIIAAGFSILAGLVALGAGLYFIIMSDSFAINIPIGFAGYYDQNIAGAQASLFGLLSVVFSILLIVKYKRRILRMILGIGVALFSAVGFYVMTRIMSVSEYWELLGALPCYLVSIVLMVIALTSADEKKRRKRFSDVDDEDLLALLEKMNKAAVIDENKMTEHTDTSCADSCSSESDAEKTN
ncbi:MAG: hypothetical protein ACLTEK_01255 [Christensenellales bacterium]